MSKVVRSVRVSLVWFVSLLLGLYVLLAGGVLWSDATWTPGLALDLAGGQEIILRAVLSEDEAQQGFRCVPGRTDDSQQDPEAESGQITEADLQQAVEIIRLRIDASGVAEAEIGIQGTDTIVVGLPGTPDDATIDLISQSAQLQFRPVIVAAMPFAMDPDTLEDGGGSWAAEAPDCATTDGSSFDWITDELFQAFAALDCTDPANRSGVSMGNPNAGHAACSLDGMEKLILGPVELVGDQLSSATSGPELSQTGIPTGRFVVNIQFTSDGATAFDRIAGRLYTFPPGSDQNRFAMVLDGAVLSAPSVQVRSFGGSAQITGDFTQQRAETLANQLQFGAIPLTLEMQSNRQIAATLGQEQLERGLLAGAIGLLLVFIYLLIQYRALGLVAISALILAGGTTFALISLLSWGMDYRLSLAGVAGLIVSIGITADSFIVYFERVRDELRDGRSLPSAVQHAWLRARRTILASDVMSLVAAATLYVLAVGGVRGFAFTLGLITFVDVFIVFLFTHPVMTLLARSRFFAEGHRLSGLDPRSLGREALYKGRGRVKAAPAKSTPSPRPEDVQDAAGLTLAERKAAAAKAAASGTSAEGSE